MRIYTKTGDDGTSGLFGGTRVSKCDLRLDAFGTVDELNCILGLVAATTQRPESQQILLAIQADLFALGADLATPGAADETRGRTTVQRVSSELTAHLEAAIDEIERRLAPLEWFILPGGTVAAGHLHVARAVCRRAERCIVELASREPLNPEIVRYMNRLSDLLFVMARAENQNAGVPDLKWEADKR